MFRVFQVLLNDADRLPILPSRQAGSYFVSVTGLSWQIPFEPVHGNCIAATIANDAFTFGPAARYRLSVMQRSTNGALSTEFEVEMTFSESMLTQYVVAGAIGTGLLGLLLALARVVRNSDKTKRLDVLMDFLKFELVLGISIATEAWDIVSDGLVVAAVSNDPIGKSLAMYYYVTFGVSCAASLLAIAIKIQLVVFKLRKRNRAGKGKVEASAAALLRMGDEFDELELQIKEAVGAFLLSMFEVR